MQSRFSECPSCAIITPFPKRLSLCCSSLTEGRRRMEKCFKVLRHVTPLVLTSYLVFITVLRVVSRSREIQVVALSLFLFLSRSDYAGE